MKTESTVSTVTSALVEGDVDREADPLDVGRNPGLEIRAGLVRLDVQVGRLEMKSRPFHCRKLQLGFGYGLVKLVAQIRFDQMNEVLELLRSLGVPHELTQLAEGTGVFEKGEPVPLREGSVVVRRQGGKELAKGPITWRPLPSRGETKLLTMRKSKVSPATPTPGSRQRPRPATALRLSRSA